MGGVRATSTFKPTEVELWTEVLTRIDPKTVILPQSVYAPLIAIAFKNLTENVINSMGIQELNGINEIKISVRFKDLAD